MKLILVLRTCVMQQFTCWEISIEFYTFKTKDMFVLSGSNYLLSLLLLLFLHHTYIFFYLIRIDIWSGYKIRHLCLQSTFSKNIWSFACVEDGEKSNFCAAGVRVPWEAGEVVTLVLLAKKVSLNRKICCCAPTFIAALENTATITLISPKF